MMRNIEAKVPAERWLEIKGALLAIREAATPAAGEEAVAGFLERHGREFPAACRSLSEDLPARVAHLQLPWRLRKFLRTTNLCERSFVEERRRSKTLPRHVMAQSGQINRLDAGVLDEASRLANTNRWTFDRAHPNACAVACSS